jgi:hypothetical protein
MIDGFFGSKTRVKILRQFLLNDESRYYLRQLARDLSLQVNSVRRELKHLETCGLLLEVDYHNNSTILSDKSNLEGIKGASDKKYYEVNKNFVLFPEIRSLILKSQTLAGQNLVEELRAICDPKLLLLTGAFVGQGNFPTDMLLVASVPKGKLLELIKKLEHDLGREINYTVMDEAEFRYRQEIVDVFLHNILQAKKLVLINEWNLALSEEKGPGSSSK